MDKLRHRDVIPSLVFVLLGGFFIFEARSMTTFGAVFPMLAGGGMLIGGLALCGRAVLFDPISQRPVGTFGRPLLLLLVLLLWALALPMIGFAESALLAAVTVILVATQETPRAKTIAAQILGVAILIAVITLIFGTLLKVQLP